MVFKQILHEHYVFMILKNKKFMLIIDEQDDLTFEFEVEIYF
jgi:hypothetical protein